MLSTLLYVWKQSILQIDKITDGELEAALSMKWPQAENRNSYLLFQHWPVVSLRLEDADSGGR